MATPDSAGNNGAASRASAGAPITTPSADAPTAAPRAFPAVSRRVKSLECETQDYRARLTVRDTGCGDVLQAVLAQARSWACEVAARFSADEALAALSDVPAFARGSACWPSGWHGSAQTGAPFAFCTARFDAGGKSAWALEMDHGDGSERAAHRRWHVRVGVLGDAERVTLNIQVTHRMAAGCFAAPAPALPSVPKLVRAVAALDGASVSVGSDQALFAPREVTAKTFKDVMARRLLDKGREMPIVAVCADEGGYMPVCPEVDLAAKVAGMAQVMELDMSDPALKRAADGFFTQAAAFSWDCRLMPGALVVYLPGLDMAKSPTGRLYVFSANQMRRNRERRQAEHLAGILADGLSRSIGRRDSDVLEVSDIEWLRSASGANRLQERLRELSAAMPPQGAQPAAQGAPVPEGAPDAAGEGEEVAALREGMETWRALAEDMDAENTRLREAEVAMAEENDALRARAAQAEQKAAALGQALASRERGSADCLPAQVLQAVPRTLEDVLRYAEAVWPTRIALTPESWKGAGEWNDDVGSVSEEYEIVKAVAEVLYDLHDEAGGGDITRAFQEASGYELALKEGKMTKRDSSLTSLRNCRWEGREYQADAHVKGRNPKVGFRLYYAWDKDRRRIVIGHVGSHLRTYGTARKSINV